MRVSLAVCIVASGYIQFDAMLEWFTYIFVALGFAYIGLILLAAGITPSLLFAHSIREWGRDSDRYTRIPLADGTGIAVQYLENPDARLLLLYHHGNAEDLDEMEERLEWFRENGFAVLAYDYPGYGSSEGRPTPKNCLEAAETVLTYACTDLGWEKSSILSYGRSLGGAPCLTLAEHHRLSGAVLESTFVSVFRVVTRYPLLPWDIYNNLSRIRRAQCPVLILHGTQDTTVPFYHGPLLLKHAPPGSDHLWVEGANHINLIETAGEAYWEKLLSFARQAHSSHSSSS